MLASDIFVEREHVMHGHSWTCLLFTGLSDCRIEDTHHTHYLVDRILAQTNIDRS